MFVTTGDNNATFAIDPCQYSSWLRLRRVLAWGNRFIDNGHTPPPPLEIEVINASVYKDISGFRRAINHRAGSGKTSRQTIFMSVHLHGKKSSPSRDRVRT